MTLLDKIKSDTTALYLTLAASIVIFPNVFYVAYYVGAEMPIPGLREVQAFVTASFISWSVVYFALKRDVKASVAFATFEMLISITYYWLRLMFTDEGDFKVNFDIISGLLFACFLPWSVKYYASSASSVASPEKIRDKLHYDDEFTHNENIFHLQKNNKELGVVLDMRNIENEILKEEIKGYQEIQILHEAQRDQLISEKAWLKDIVVKHATKITPEQAIKLNEL